MGRYSVCGIPFLLQKNMWVNYFLTSIRALKGDRFFVFANLFCLALAFALVVIGYFNFTFNHQFNKYFEGHEKLFKLNGSRSGNLNDRVGVVPVPIAPLINENVSGVTAVRYHAISAVLKVDNELFQEKIAFTDPEFLELFPYESIDNNNPEPIGKGEIILSHETALKLFGTEPAIGSTLSFILPDGSEKSLIVANVLKEYPENTSFHFSAIMEISEYFASSAIGRNDWSFWVDGTFVQVQETHQRRALLDFLQGHLAIQNERNPGNTLGSYSLDNILDWPNFENKLYRSSFFGILHPASVLGTISSGIFVLLLACFNFINVSISLSGKRLKELAMRRIMGSGSYGIIFKFLIENAFLVFLAITFSVGIIYFLVPHYNALFQFNIVQFQFLDLGPFIVFSLVTFLLVVLVAGGYPAYYASRFSPLAIFSREVKIGNSNWMMSLLLVLQFMICFYNVFSLIIFIENSYYQQSLSRGYELENVINIPLGQDEGFKESEAIVQNHRASRETSGTTHLIGFGDNEVQYQWRSSEGVASEVQVGEGYLELLKIPLVSGRYLRKSDASRGIIVNQTFVEEWGTNLLGEHLFIEDTSYTVVGVVQDFNLRTIVLDNKIPPVIIKLVEEPFYNYLTVKLETDNPLLVNEELRASWNDLHPNDLYQGFLQTKVLNHVEQTNEIIISINGFVAFSALLISILGLYATLSLSVQRRIKEFGMRKVLGASVWHIAYVLNRRILLLMLIAGLLGLSGGYWFISGLLDIIYAYHMEIAGRHFLYPIFAVLLLVAFFLSSKVYNTATTNPVDHLRSE